MNCATLVIFMALPMALLLLIQACQGQHSIGILNYQHQDTSSSSGMVINS